MFHYVQLKPRTPDLNGGRTIIKADAYRVYEEAQAIRKRAEAEAEAILSQAHAAFTAEAERGYQEGQKRADAERRQAMLELSRRHLEYLTTLERQTVQIVMEALGRILDGFDDTELTLGIVRQALQLLCNEKQILLIVPPDQLGPVKQRVQQLLQAFPGIDFIEVRTDAALIRGHCRLETPVAVVNANIQEQLSAIAEAIGERLAQRPELDPADESDPLLQPKENTHE